MTQSKNVLYTEFCHAISLNPLASLLTICEHPLTLTQAVTARELRFQFLLSVINTDIQTVPECLSYGKDAIVIHVC